MSNIKKWQIIKANLEPAVGSEQGKFRPVLIISENDINALLNCVTILPITSRKPNRRIYPNEVLLMANTVGLPNESIVLCHQIRTVDKKRLSLFYGEISQQEIQSQIIEGICFQLGITPIL